MLRYPVVLKPDTNGALEVIFPDVPEAHTFGEDREEALMQAVDALETALSIYIEDRRDIPQPSAAKRKGDSVIVPALTEAKIGLYRIMRAEGVGKAELARRLHHRLPQVDRLLDPCHNSRLDQLEAAFQALGKRLTIEIHEAA